MKILFLTDNFPPEVNAPATRTIEHCREWIAQGAEITVLTCFPNYPQGKVYDGYKNKLYQVEYIDGIKVIRLWSYMTANEGFVKRILDYISFAFMAFWAGLFKPCDVIVATSPQFFTAVAGGALGLFKRKPWVFELRDLWPESIRAVSAMKANRALDWLEKLELLLYRKSSMVIAVTNAFKTNLINRGIKAEKIEVITNGSNLDLFRARPKNEAILKELGLQNKFIFAYIGTHGLAHNLDFIVNCAQKIENPAIHFLFIGDGATKKSIMEIAKNLNLKNVTFCPPISKDLIPEYISISDVALVPLRKSDTFKTVIPSKIFESACMLKPILLGVEGQALEIINEHNAGIAFEPENEAEYVTQVLRIYNDKELYKTIQNGCQQLSLAYDRKKLATQMLGLLKSIVKK
jgi:glycosyltransferase involved in cell wall biosynthesis